MVSVSTLFSTVALADRAEIIMGQSPAGSTYNGHGAGMPFLQGKAEFGDVFPSPTKWTSQPLRLAPKGSTLVSVRAPVGDANLADQEYCIGRGLAALVAGSDLDSEFLYFWAMHCKGALESEGTGSTFKAIRKSVLTDLALLAWVMFRSR